MENRTLSGSTGTCKSVILRMNGTIGAPGLGMGRDGRLHLRLRSPFAHIPDPMIMKDVPAPREVCPVFHHLTFVVVSFFFYSTRKCSTK